MFNIVIRLDSEYFLAAIDTATGTYITAEDTACFQTVDKLARKHIGFLNRPEILYRLEDRAYTLKHIEGFNTEGEDTRLVIDGSLTMWAARPDYIEELLIEASQKTELLVLDDNLLSVISDMVTDIEGRSDYWGKYRRPKYPLDNCKLEVIRRDENFDTKDDNMIVTGAHEEITVMRSPYNQVMFPIAEAQEVIRAYSDTLDSGDYMFGNVRIDTTAEFLDDDDEDTSAGEEYRISPQEIMPPLSSLIPFKYYVQELITDQSLLSIAKESVDSVHYKQNLRVLNPTIRANNEFLQYVVGSDTIACEFNPNEEAMHEALKVLMFDLLMYESKCYNTTELLKLGEARSKLFDDYMLDILKRLLIENYSYTGKASMTFADNTRDDSGDAADVDTFGIFGYNKTVYEDGQYKNYLPPDEWLRIKESLNPDGPQRIGRYLSSVTNNLAYADMLLFMLRFGQTKSRYIKVQSLDSVSKPYFDTLKFEPITTPVIVGKFTPAKTEHNKEYYLDGSVYLHRQFEVLSGNQITLPIAVVLKRKLVSGPIVKEERLLIDINSFCAAVFTKIDGELPYSIEGIDIEDSKPTLNLEYLRETASQVYRIEDALAMLNSEDEVCITAMSSRLQRLLSRYKLDAGIKTAEVVSIYDAYANLENHKYTYEEISSDFTPSDCLSRKDYVYKKILKDLLQPLFNTTLSSQFRQVDTIDILVEKQESIKETIENTGADKLSFSSLLRYRQKSCKIMNDTDEVKGYIFSSEYEGRKYMLVASTEDIGLNLPVTDNWFKYPYEKICSGITKPYEKSTDKLKFKKDKEERGMYFASNNTIELLS